MLIKAAVAETALKPLTIRELHLREPCGNEILVRTIASGVCHTDVLVRDQLFGPALPAVLGHEGAGIVEMVGPGVRGVKVGDCVVLTQASCGWCRQCRTAHPMNCDNYTDYNLSGNRANGKPAYKEDIGGGFVGQSSFATHMITYETNTVVLPAGFPLERAAPLGCGFVTGASAVLNVQRPSAASSMLVMGAGAVGMAAIMAAAIQGCAPIIAVDLNEGRLARAHELGATHLFNGKDPDLIEQVLSLVNGGVEFAIDAVGLPATLEATMKASAPGAHIVLLGAIGIGQSASIDILSLAFNRKVQGAIQGSQIPQQTIPQLIAWNKAGQFPYERLLKFYDFENINDAFRDLEESQTIKPVLLFS